MARKFLTAIDLTKNEIQNAVAQNLAGAPAAPVKGQFYFNSTDNTLYWWDGTQWVPAKDAGGSGFPGYAPAGSTVAETTFGLAKADGAASTVARADHTHGSPVHDAAAHSTIPISALGPATGPIDMGGFPIHSVGAPTQPGDATNKFYVDNLVAGLSWKDSVRVATTANISVTDLQTIDGVALAVGDRVLVKNNTTVPSNGIWVAAAGPWLRAVDADNDGELVGAAVFVEQGATQADTAWVVTTDAPIVIGTTPVTWAQFAGGGAVGAGAGLYQTGNVLNVGQDGGPSIIVNADTISRAALTGDVTAVVGSNATVIANNAVTNVKAADMPANTFKGNNTAAVADPKDLTVAEMQAALGITAGEIVTGGAGLVKTGSTLDVVGDASIVVGADVVSRAALTGDVTAAAGANATTIAFNAVSNLKLADMPALTLKGNNAGVAADPLDLTLTQLGAMLGGTLMRRYSVAVGGAVSQVITHNLNATDVLVAVYRNSAPRDEIECDVEHTNATTVTLRFAVAPAAAEYQCVVMG